MWTWKCFPWDQILLREKDKINATKEILKKRKQKKNIKNELKNLSSFKNKINTNLNISSGFLVTLHEILFNNILLSLESSISTSWSLVVTFYFIRVLRVYGPWALMEFDISMVVEGEFIELPLIYLELLHCI